MQLSVCSLKKYTRLLNYKKNPLYKTRLIVYVKHIYIYIYN